MLNERVKLDSLMTCTIQREEKGVFEPALSVELIDGGGFFITYEGEILKNVYSWQPIGGFQLYCQSLFSEILDLVETAKNAKEDIEKVETEEEPDLVTLLNSEEVEEEIIEEAPKKLPFSYTYGELEFVSPSMKELITGVHEHAFNTYGEMAYLNAILTMNNRLMLKGRKVRYSKKVVDVNKSGQYPVAFVAGKWFMHVAYNRKIAGQVLTDFLDVLEDIQTVSE